MHSAQSVRQNQCSSFYSFSLPLCFVTVSWIFLKAGGAGNRKSLFVNALQYKLNVDSSRLHNLTTSKTVVTFILFHLALFWIDRSYVILPQKLMSACNTVWKRNMNRKRAFLWFLIVSVARETSSPSMDGMGSDQLLPPKASYPTSQDCTEQIRNKTE